MLSAILATTGTRTWLGGNIGLSLLDQLPQIQPGDRVVLELSSFQLAHLSSQAPPPLGAVVTSCTPNHLDWHGSWEAYAAAKRRLVDSLPADGFAVTDPTDSLVRSWTVGLRAATVPAWPLDRIPPLRVPGDHNRRNAALAAAAAARWRATPAGIDRALQRFRGLAHRCEALDEVAGRRMIDDSKSTTPEATLAALSACTGRVWLLLGGQDKGADFGPLADAVVRRAAGAACFGTLGGQLQALLAERLSGFRCCAVAELPSAFAWCWDRSAPGDTILLSPACASLDQFRDFEHRADTFRDLAAATRQDVDP